MGAGIILISWFVADWITGSLRNEKTALEWRITDLQGQVEKLRKEVQSEEKKLAEVQTCGVELVRDKGNRWIKLGKGYQPGKKVKWDDGRVGFEVIQKK